MAIQKDLFAEPESTQSPSMPSGFRYQDDVISEAEEVALVASLATLKLKPFEFHGHVGNRRVTSFGLRYDYARRAVEPAERFPLFIEELRRKAAAFAGINVDQIQQDGVNEYPPGAGIGWHKDKPQFGVIVGVSLLAPAVMRLRLPTGTSWIASHKHLNHDRSTFWKAKPERVGSMAFRLSSRCDIHLCSGPRCRIDGYMAEAAIKV